MAANSLSIRTSSSPARHSPTPKSTNGDAPPPINTALGGAITDSSESRGPKSSSTLTPGPPLATPTTATTITPPTPATIKKGPSKLTRKDTATTAILRISADDGPGKIPGLNTNSRSNTSPAPSPAVTSPTSNPGVDPLSQHIFARTNTDATLSKGTRIRNPTAAKSDQPDSPAGAAEPIPRQSSDLTGRQQSLGPGDASKDKKKGGSFLSRLGIRKTKTDNESIADSESEFSGEPRMNGADAYVFSNNVEAAGYIPHHKTPPRYIRVRAHNKKNQDREFNRMFLAQELVGTHPKVTGEGEQADDKIPIVTVSVAGAGGRRREKTGGAIWATEFSRDGKYLAAAGKDGVVRIWAVISTQEERRTHEEEEAALCPIGERLSAPVFLERPVREFSGHANEILDLSWSKNNFLLSTSMDKTVKLWHISRDDCLCTFKHKDLVTKVAFHPTDDRFFLAGSLDMNLRLWSIPDKSVAYSVHLPDLITAVAFSPDGKTAIAGLLNGLCMLYETEGLKFQSQIHARSSRGKNSKGSKITGIRTAAMPLTSGGSNGTEPGEVKIMVSTNDSRIRVYNLKDGSLDTKFKGHENVCTQISASFSEDAQYIITGSENSKTFIWKMGSAVSGGESKDKHPCESFDAHGEIVTTALFAPTSTKQLLSASGDPIYDLCNPPPVVLMSADEALASATASQVALSEAGTEDQNLDKPPPTPSFMAKKTEPSPAYVARTAHRSGNIIVTTDDQGVIKVFRQDCAFGKRRHDSWETGSTLSRKPGGMMTASGTGRSASIRTRTSTGSAAHSRRGSLSTGPWVPPGTPKLPSDMILSWRQNVEGGSGRPISIAGSLPTPTRSERSISPGKNNATRSPAGGSRGNLAADARKQQYVLASPRHLPVNGEVPDSPTSSIGSRLRPKTASAAEQQPRKHVPTPLQLSSGDDKSSTTTTKAESVLPPRRAATTREDSSGSKKSSNSKKKVEDEDDFIMSPPVPSFSFKSSDGGNNGTNNTNAAAAAAPETPRPDPAGPGTPSASNFGGFWNLNRWKGLAGLKGSGAGGESSSSSNGNKKQHNRTASDAILEMPTPGFIREASDEGPRRKSLADAVVTRPKTLGQHRMASGLSTVASREDLKENNNSSSLKLSAAAGNNSNGSSPSFLRADSVVSKLSSEMTTASSENNNEQDAIMAASKGGGENEPCAKCGAKKQRTKKIQGKQRVVCGRCGSVVFDA